MSSCDFPEDFLYAQVPQDGPSGTSAAELSQSQLEGWLKRFKDAVVDCIDDANSPPYGEIHAEGNSTETSIAVANTWYQVTVFDANGNFGKTTPDYTESHIEITEAGLYYISVSASIESGAGAGATYEGGVWKNNGATHLESIRWDRDLGGGGGDVGSTSMTGLANLSVGDTVEVWVQNKTNTTNILFQDINLTVFKVSD